MTILLLEKRMTVSIARFLCPSIRCTPCPTCTVPTRNYSRKLSCSILHDVVKRTAITISSLQDDEVLTAKKPGSPEKHHWMEDKSIVAITVHTRSFILRTPYLPQGLSVVGNQP